MFTKANSENEPLWDQKSKLHNALKSIVPTGISFDLKNVLSGLFDDSTGNCFIDVNQFGCTFFCRNDGSQIVYVAIVDYFKCQINICPTMSLKNCLCRIISCLARLF